VAGENEPVVFLLGALRRADVCARRAALCRHQRPRRRRVAVRQEFWRGDEVSEAIANAPFLPRRILMRIREGARRRRRAVTVWLLALIASVAALFLLDPAGRLMAAPAAAIALTTLLFVLVLWARDGAPPVFEAGLLCMLATAVYGTLPMAGFILMHGQWDP